MRTRWGLLGLVLLAGSAFGAEKAYVTAPSNEIIQVDFDARTTKTVVRDRGKNFEGLAVRRDGPDQFKLVVANLTFGSDLRIYDPVTGSGSRITRFRGAHGVALSPYGHLFSLGGVWAWSQVAFVPRRTACDATPQPSGCSPGGYGPLQLIDEKVRVGGRFVHWLSDLRVANTTGGGLLEPGELAVLVTSPPMVIAYTPEEDSWHCAPDCEPRVVVPESELKGHILTGIEIASDSILISTAKGAILKAKKGTGGPEVSPFVFLPGKGVKLSVGVESGTEVVYATVATKKGSLHRFDVETGTPLGNAITKGIKVPHGVGNESSSIVLTAAGSNVKINLPTMQAVFDEVLQSGSTDAQCNLYPAPSDLPRDVRLSELGIALEPGTDVVIPAHIEPFRVGNPTTGALSYYICIIDNTAAFANNYQLTEFEDQYLEYEPECETFNAHPFTEARMFYAPNIGNGEDNIAEATDYDHLGDLDQITVFTDVSTDCGCNIGRGWKFSFIMPAAQSTLPVCQIESAKLEKLAESVRSDDFFADHIAGPGCSIPADLPDGVDVQPAFIEAGLGSVSDWTLVSDGSWETGGNGLLLGGGDVTFEFREAGGLHAFGVSDTGKTNFTEVFRISPPTDPVPTPGQTFVMSPQGEPYLMYFENLDFIVGRAFSDGDATDDRLDMLIFRNNQDPRYFALLYDDGGAGPDADYNDLIVTARGDINTQCEIESLLARSSTALGQALQCGGNQTGKVEEVLSNLQAVSGLLSSKPGDFDDSIRNVTGEIEARVESSIFMGCKLIGGTAAICPIPPGGPSHY